MDLLEGFYPNENNIEILTPSGFKKYKGIQINKSQSLLEIHTSSNVLKCTKDHKLFSNNIFKEAQELNIGDYIKTIDGEEEIISIIELPQSELVADLVEVEDINSYYTNNILSHNCNLLYLDEFAFVEGADEFFTSTFPVVSSGTSSKVIISSTPRGLNLFYRIYKDATEKRNEFFPIEVHWSDVPGRDDKWKEQMISTLTESGFRQEYGNEFLGSADTLINVETLRSLRFTDPIHTTDGFRVFEEPKKNQKYFMMVDVARGVGKNYSAFIIVNVSEIPYKVVATFKRNDIVPMAYPAVINSAARKYNEAQVLVEINDVGGQIVDILFHDLEYENILSVNNTNDQVLTTGFSSDKFKRGIRTTRTTKRLGCSNMKTLVEGHKVVLNDFELISELSTFVLHPDGKYGAEEGYNDDLAMCLVLFGWLAAQKNFSEYTDNSIRKELIKETEEVIDRDLLPIGFFGSFVDEHRIEGDPDNDFWESVANQSSYF